MVSCNFVVFCWWNVNIKLAVLCFYMDFLSYFFVFIPVSSFSEIYFVRIFLLPGEDVSAVLLIIDKPVYCSKTKSSRVFTSEKQTN